MSMLSLLCVTGLKATSLSFLAVVSGWVVGGFGLVEEVVDGDVDRVVDGVVDGVGEGVFGGGVATLRWLQDPSCGVSNRKSVLPSEICNLEEAE